jgi:predicted metal-dependent HD superfamily phosphohydrolase
MIPADIVQKASAYVRQLFSDADTKELHFHNYEHTEEVVHRTNEIAQKESVTPEEMEILQLAAWFHDTGHLTGAMQDHEVRSAAAARNFFAAEGVHDEAFIQRVTDCIMATRMPQAPSDKLGEIMCDADVYHFGTPQFKKTNKRVRKELKARGYPAMAKNWTERSLRLLQSQHFFTPYSRQKLEAGKAENIRWLQQKLAEKHAKNAAVTEGPIPPLIDEQNTEQANKEADKFTQNLITRGTQTFMRLASSNHFELSRMADGKSHILISVNAIIISVVLSFFIDKLDYYPYLLIPTILFLATSVVTVVLSILATRPQLTEGTFTRENIQRKETNLLFFGNFYRSSLEDYTWAVRELIQDKDYMYNTMIKDVYFLGVVLGRKYRLLRWAYNVFMLGLIIAVVSFSIAIALNAPYGHTNIINANGAPL